MISSISSSSQMQRPAPPPSQPMTDAQKESASEILSNYDSSSISTTELESMKAAFEAAGIKPSEDLKGIMEEAGFEVPERPGPQGVKGQEKPPPPPEFSKLMEKLGSSGVSEEEIQSYIQNLQNEKGEFGGALMDNYA